VRFLQKSFTRERERQSLADQVRALSNPQRLRRIARFFDKCGQNADTPLSAMFVNPKGLDFIGRAEQDRTVDLLNKTQTVWSRLRAFRAHLNFIQAVFFRVRFQLHQL
jgi:hypothetical protein